MTHPGRCRFTVEVRSEVNVIIEIMRITAYLLKILCKPTVNFHKFQDNILEQKYNIELRLFHLLIQNFHRNWQSWGMGITEI